MNRLANEATTSRSAPPAALRRSANDQPNVFSSSRAMTTRWIWLVPS
jgi:hypothetical protein